MKKLPTICGRIEEKQMSKLHTQEQGTAACPECNGTGDKELHEMLAYLAMELFGWEYKDWNGFGESWNQPLNSLLSGNWMLNIIESMRDGKHGGWRVYLYVNGDCMTAFSRDDDEYAPDDYITHVQRTGRTLPEAVVRAAHIALHDRIT